jgi:hypothetical protein
MLFHKLDSAKWTSWPGDEVAAIRTLLETWKRVLTSRSRDSERAVWELDELSGAISAL